VFTPLLLTTASLLANPDLVVPEVEPPPQVSITDRSPRLMAAAPERSGTAPEAASVTLAASPSPSFSTNHQPLPTSVVQAAAPTAKPVVALAAPTPIAPVTSVESPSPAIAWSPKPQITPPTPVLTPSGEALVLAEGPNDLGTDLEGDGPGDVPENTPEPELELEPEPVTPAVTPATEQSAETEDELFERIFGRPRPQAQAIAIPLFINEQAQGQAVVDIAGETAQRVQGRAVLDRTRAILQPEVQGQLEAAIDEDGFLAVEDLRQAGLEVIFDPSRLELYLQIPPALRQTNVINQFGLPPEAAEALPTSTVSGYVNLRAGQNIAWSGSGRQPLNLALDGALNVSGWVLEGSGNWVEGRAQGFSRGDVRLVRDDTTQAIRYVMGDLSIPVTGTFQTVVPMVGISASRNYALQPYRVTRPTGEYTFFLERPATVEVFINDSRVQQLRLQPGPQDIRNLPLSTGTNDVQLIITDDLGQVQRLNFSAALAGNLLAPGLQQFSYNLGFPSGSGGGGRQYQWDTPVLSLAHRWGARDDLTLGGYLQATPTFQLLETDGVWATTAGNFAWAVAASHQSEVGIGAALRAQYELPRDRNDPTHRTFRVAAEYRSDQFTTLSSSTPSNTRLDLSATYSQRIFGDTSANLSGSYRMGREVPDTYNVNLGLSRSLGQGLRGNVNLSYGRNAQGQEDLRAFLGVNWLITQGRQSVGLNTNLSNTNEMSNRLSWRHSPDRRLQSPRPSVDLNRNSRGYTLTGRLNYTDYRFDTGLTQEIAWPNQAATTANTRLTFGTALAFADGHFSWSRPINNSFVMVVPRDRWRGQTIGVNPSSRGYGAVADGLGPAVLPDVSPYYVSRVRLEAPDAPLGYDLGPDHHVVMPSYRSGTVIRAGTEATVFLRGVLLDQAGEPIGLQAGEVVSVSDPQWDAQPLFTNRVGRFAVMGLTPGRYEIRLLGRPDPVASFEIPAHAEGIYDLDVSTGNLVPLRD
jgi:outer membrane usher protein